MPEIMNISKREKTMTDVLTIEEILKRKDLIDNNEYSYYHLKVFNKDIQVDEIDPQEIIDIVNELDETESRRNLKLIYASCPIFKAPELHQAFEDKIKEPYDIIKVILKNNLGEIADLTRFILKKYGLLDEELVDKIKKQ